MIGDQKYETLDEIIEKYIGKCNEIMATVVTHKKFIKGSLD